jgi:hypothetical protein
MTHRVVIVGARGQAAGGACRGNDQIEVEGRHEHRAKVVL